MSKVDPHTEASATPQAINPVVRSVKWVSTGNDVTLYRALVDGEEWAIRVNDFPDEHLYTLLVNGRESQQLDDWPACWSRPGKRGKR